MNTPNKLPEIKKEAFSKARESLGLSTKDLSGMACLSVRQIEQIENGETSSFYGPQIKVTAAKKVARLLKLDEKEAFDFGDVVPNKKNASEAVVEETKPKAREATDSVEATSAKKSEKPAKSSEVVAVKKNELSQEQEVKKSPAFGETSHNHSRKKIFIIGGIAAAVVLSIVNLRPLFFPEVVKEEIVALQESANANPAPEAASDAKSSPVVSAPSPEPASPAPVAVAAAPNSSECPAADTTAVTYKPDAPKKAGDMVYLQSKTAQTVCVVDASGKIQNKLLEAGVGTSIYGKPPLKVLTSGQVPVDMYYQGVKVRLANTSSKTIYLEPAEIIQPLAPTDSQFR